MALGITVHYSSYRAYLWRRRGASTCPQGPSIRDLIEAAPDSMAVITILISGMVLAAAYGLFHSAYSRRLVVGTLAIIAVVLLIFAILVVVRVIGFPMMYA